MALYTLSNVRVTLVGPHGLPTLGDTPPYRSKLVLVVSLGTCRLDRAPGPPAPPARIDVPDDRSDAGTELGAAASDDGTPHGEMNDFLNSITRHHDDGVDYVDAMAA